MMTTNEIKSEIRGLCMTCNHAGFCIYLASASSPVWCCEEFDDRPQVIEQKASHRKQPASSRETRHPLDIHAERQMRKVS